MPKSAAALLARIMRIHEPKAREKLWELFKEQASGMDGGDVVLALKQAGEEIWGVGIDDTYSSVKHQNDEALGNAFDITWLTIICIKLKEIKDAEPAIPPKAEEIFCPRCVKQSLPRLLLPHHVCSRSAASSKLCRFLERLS
jgi:hypothetical protein